MKVSLIIPAYNEERRLPVFLESIKQWLQEHPEPPVEVLVVDDGSTDATVAVARRFADMIPTLRVISQDRNRGKGAAVARGVHEATGDLIVFSDADGATPIDELPHMVEELITHDVAVGNRWQRGAHAKKSTPLRHFAGWVYKQYMGLFGLSNVDTMCGFKGYKTQVARDLFRNLLEPRWLFDTEVAYRAVLRNYSVSNFPIRWESKDGSKLSRLDLLISGLRVLPVILNVRRAEKASQSSNNASNPPYQGGSV